MKYARRKSRKVLYRSMKVVVYSLGKFWSLSLLLFYKVKNQNVYLENIFLADFEKAFI